MASRRSFESTKKTVTQQGEPNIEPELEAQSVQPRVDNGPALGSPEARRYERIKLRVSIANIALSIILPLVLLFSTI